jgi:hypothetical protein
MSIVFVASVVTVFGLVCFFLGMVVGLNLAPGRPRSVARAASTRVPHVIGASRSDPLRERAAPVGSTRPVMARRVAVPTRPAVVVDTNLLAAALL